MFFLLDMGIIISDSWIEEMMENVIKEVGGGYFCYDFLLVGCMGCIIF